MSDYMVYWKNYWRDAEEFGYIDHSLEWHTRNEKTFHKLEPGNDLWVIVRAGLDHPCEWRLLMKIRIWKLEIDSDLEKYWVQEYGPFHAIGDPKNSEIFDISGQPDFTPFLRRLTFKSGKTLQTTGELIGRSFQSDGPLSNKDSEILARYSDLLEALNPI